MAIPNFQGTVALFHFIMLKYLILTIDHSQYELNNSS